VLGDDEKIMRIKFDKICGNSHELFSHTMVLKQWVHLLNKQKIPTLSMKKQDEKPLDLKRNQ